MLPEFVWDASALEGSPLTFLEVKTLLDGATVAGRRIADQAQILNLAKSIRRLLTLVKARQFALTKATFTELHINEVPERCLFRGENQESHYSPDVGRGAYRRYTSLPTVAGGIDLNRIFVQGATAVDKCVPNQFEKATAFFLFGAMHQFFSDGNECTSRLMMNGLLMSAGIDAISVPAAKAQEFGEKMMRFYLTKDATEMMAFLVDCHPDAEQIRAANRGVRKHPLKRRRGR